MLWLNPEACCRRPAPALSSCEAFRVELRAGHRAWLVLPGAQLVAGVSVPSRHTGCHLSDQAQLPGYWGGTSR